MKIYPQFLTFFIKPQTCEVFVTKHTFFKDDNQSNLSIKLCATNLRTRAKRKQKIVQGHGQFNIDCDNIVLSFEGFKVSYLFPRLTVL